MTGVHLSAQAEVDLADIWLFIAQDDPDAADRFIDRIYRKCRILADSPGIGRARPDLAKQLRSFPVGHYLIYYRPTATGIEIARVLSGYRDILAIFEAD